MDTDAKSSPKMQIVAAILANIPTFIYGVQIGWLSPMAPVLRSGVGVGAPSVADDVITWMATALPLAAIVSLPMFGWSSDYFGRKKSIIALSFVSAVSWVLKLTTINPAGLISARALAGIAAGGCFLVVPAYLKEISINQAYVSWVLKLTTINPAGLISARALAGIAAGGCFLVVPAYLKEISEDCLRGALGSLLVTSCNLGVVTVYVLGMLLSYRANQAVYLAISLLHAAAFCFLPESPAFLVKRGKTVEAVKVITWLRSLKEDDKNVQQEIENLKQEETLFRETPKVTFKHILTEKVIIRPLVVCLVLIGVQTLSGCFAIVNYAAAIFEKGGSGMSPNLLALFVGALQLTGSCVATASIEWFGRKVLLATSSFIISVCMATLATCFMLGPQSLPPWLPVAAVCVCIFFFGAGLAPVPFVIMAEVFSFQLRSRLLGLIMTLSWLDSTLTVLLYARVAAAFGEHVVFFCFAAITMFGAVFTALLVPETRGKTLDEIQRRFAGKQVDIVDEVDVK